MKNSKIISLLIFSFIALLVLSGCTQQTTDQGQNTDTGTDNTGNTQGDDTDTTPQTYTIEFTANGFSPSPLTIKQGDTVTWVNKSDVSVWPASAMHPTHTRYEGVNYDEEGSYQGSLACKGEGVAKEGAFDPCKGLEPNESWSFTFTQKGTWGYHNHLDATKFGQIIVE